MTGMRDLSGFWVKFLRVRVGDNSAITQDSVDLLELTYYTK